ncbi:bifunctional 4-hydroxy-2-oxoglutarate aldolase/2-dehydro-3-deoxy-phosphogluconate aldolase [Agromyces sp. SYSU T00194]|uniref:bifunctional 4-hydroxy-2-oxoglutarate aldolase/2-dehydro-3-deoxy-phosphogluconate aldolase n=1 Tax=Agromyces chitinivorans TaxID=3158560 RepID=UPI0033937E4D
MTLDGVGIVPVVVIDDAARAPGLVAALAEGGIRCAEITMRTDAGIDAMREASAALPEGFLVGAGTVLTGADVERAVDAGARFIVSPGLDDEVLARCASLDVPVVPGVATATEVQRALRAGLDRLKLFPAGVLGGLAMISALAGPFPQVRFLPSGGVGPANAAEYAASPHVFAVSGSWMAPRELIAAGDWDEITRRSRAAMELVGA